MLTSKAVLPQLLLFTFFNMADISLNLKEYLSKSSKNSTSANNGGINSYFPGRSVFGMFPGKDNAETQSVDDTANTWFAQAESDPCLPSLSKRQRVVGFIMCLLMGSFCFSLASLYIPLLVLKARKFAMLYSLGSVFCIMSFSLLWGPASHLRHLFSIPRLPFTVTYIGTMIATIYFAVWVKSTLFTIFFAVAQLTALVWYVVSYIPGGQTGLKFFTKLFYSLASKTVSKTLPI